MPSYQILKRVIEQTITVVNDGAERMLGIATDVIKNQRARKEKNFTNLIFSKFDKNRKVFH